MSHIVTIKQIVTDAKNLEPRLAPRYANGDAHNLCVTPIYRAVQLEDGSVIGLHEQERMRGALVPVPDGQGQIAAGYLRVSEPDQRTARDVDLSATGRLSDPRAERGDAERDGWSEAFQAEALARHCIQQRWAFRLYSDCGISGAKPYRNQALVETLSRDHARTYERCFSKVLDALRSRFSEIDLAGMQAYMEERVRQIEAAGRADIELLGQKRSGKGEPPYRPALSELITALPLLHSLIISDLSRLSRSYALLHYLFDAFARYRLPVFAIFSSQKVNDETKEARTMQAVMSLMAEFQREDVIQGALRGGLQMLLGTPPSSPITLPHYLARNANGHLVLNDAPAILASDGHAGFSVAELMRYIVERVCALSDTVPHANGVQDGINTICRELDAWGCTVPRPSRRTARQGWLPGSIRKMCSSPALKGEISYFGKMWPVYPPLVSDEQWNRLQGALEGRKQRMATCPPNRSATYLAARLIQCRCGARLSHTAPHSTHKFHRYWCHNQRGARARADTERISHLVLRTNELDAVLERFMRFDAQLVVDCLRETLERQQLREQLERIQARLEAERARLPEQEAEAREQALAQLPSVFQSNSRLVDEAVQQLLTPHLSALEQLEAEATTVREQLAVTMSSDDLARLEDRAARWDALSIGERNGVLRTLFDRFEHRGEPPNEVLVPILNNIARYELNPIHIEAKPYRNTGWERHIEYPADYFTRVTDLERDV